MFEGSEFVSVGIERWRYLRFKFCFPNEGSLHGLGREEMVWTCIAYYRGARRVVGDIVVIVNSRSPTRS